MKRFWTGSILALVLIWSGGASPAQADHGHCGSGHYHGGTSAYRSHYGGYYGRDIYGPPPGYYGSTSRFRYLTPWPNSYSSGYRGGAMYGGLGPGFGNPNWGYSANPVYNIGPGVSVGGPWGGGVYIGF